ncbi:AEC family transporter [Neisseria perflava]|uniref:AEC family transporter n=1 Tax=Neisseria perflava TaxID=33053 RepID=UPI0020A148A9|nr:AEC family transporter [Neisseria perflava]MCP1660572.1 putative permease [Neisseria perflava]MCP1772722.1 putative permease [Neisseria perflava]
MSAPKNRAARAVKIKSVVADMAKGRLKKETGNYIMFAAFSDGLEEEYDGRFKQEGKMADFLHTVWFALNVTLPSVLLLGMGILLRRLGMADTNFIAQASKIVFYFGIPCLLYSNLMQSDIHVGEQADMLLAGAVSVLLCYALGEVYAWKFVPDIRDKGVFVQGVFRGNLGSMGLAYVLNAYGQQGIAAGAVYTGAITLLFNILGVVSLSRGQEGSLWDKLRGTLKKIMVNPLILGILAALVCRLVGFMPPQSVMKGVDYVADLSVPLALICAGAAFDFKVLSKLGDLSMLASIGRLIVAPVLTVLVGLAFGLQGMALGILFLMTATPLAAAAYPMVKAMGGNDVMAANVAGITTIGSGLSAAVGIVILRSLGLM